MKRTKNNDIRKHVMRMASLTSKVAAVAEKLEDLCEDDWQPKLRVDGNVPRVEVQGPDGETWGSAAFGDIVSNVTSTEDDQLIVLDTILWIAALERAIEILRKEHADAKERIRSTAP